MSVSIDTIVAQAAALIRTPAAMLAALLETTQQLIDSTTAAPREILNALIDASQVPTLPDAIGDTVSRVQERLNQALVADAIRLVLISEAARIIPDVTFDSVGDATTTRARLVAELDALAATAGSETFADIVNLRSAVLRAIPGDAVLARIRTIEQHVDVPSLLLSYQLYGSVDSADDIVARNGISHPGYVSGSLQVLSDV